MSNYIYIAKLHHLENKELPEELTINFTNDLNKKIKEYDSSYSIIKTLILKSWVIETDMDPKSVISHIDNALYDYKTSVKGWYNIGFTSMNERVEKTLELFLNDKNFSFKEVDLDSISIKKVRKRIRRKKDREPDTILEIIIEGKEITGNKAKETFRDFVKWVLDNGKADLKTLKKDFKFIFSDRMEDFPKNEKYGYDVLEINGYYLNCYNGTTKKLNYVKEISKRYGINVEVKQVPKRRFQSI